MFTNVDSEATNKPKPSNMDDSSYLITCLIRIMAKVECSATIKMTEAAEQPNFDMFPKDE